MLLDRVNVLDLSIDSSDPKIVNYTIYYLAQPSNRNSNRLFRLGFLQQQKKR